MTTIYIPRPIETAEQAEALPEETIATSEEFAPEVFVKVGTNEWFGTHGPGTMTNLTVVGMEALMPIEAEEEVAFMDPWEGIYDPTTREEAEELGPLPGQPLHARLVTPWQEA